ncbi:hypothetical protein O9929_12695 [Vibrio lentus]|nr:hypothetical protein [Vibrio lentus]
MGPQVAGSDYSRKQRISTISSVSHRINASLNPRSQQRYQIDTATMTLPLVETLGPIPCASALACAVGPVGFFTERLVLPSLTVR